MPATETRLLEAARRGNEGAFLDLYQRHRAPVFRFAWRLTGSVAAEEDITQECFLALLAGAAFEAADKLRDLLAVERSALVRQAIAELPPLQKEALILFEYENLPLEEIAAVVEVEVGAVKARLHRARESLRRRLAPLLNPCAERNCS